SLATRRQRENILRQVIESAGRKPFSAISEATIAAGRDRRGKTPFQARHFLDTLRGLFEWAKEDAREAIGKLVNETATSMPSPSHKVRASGEK
ncbi:MAG: integrase, partial [Pseudolabrys sp.]